MLTMVLAIALAGHRMPIHTFIIPIPLLERARLKAKLHDDLYQSLQNDQDNVLDLKLEKEIEKLELQLLKGEN